MAKTSKFGIYSKSISPSDRNFAESNTSILQELYNYIVEEHEETIDLGLFKQIYYKSEAENTLNGIHNHLGSLDEKTYYIAEASYNKGELHVEYIKSAGVGVNVDLKAQVRESILTAIGNGTLNSTSDLKEGLASNDASVQRSTILNFLEGSLGLTHLTPGMQELNKSKTKSLAKDILELIKTIPADTNESSMEF